MKYYLDGEWLLKGYKPGESEASITMNASVPDNVELELWKNGTEPDPYYAANEYLYRKYETWNWEYSRTFRLPENIKTSEKLYIVFEGVNCIADILIDGISAAHFENALIPHELEITSFLNNEDTHTLCVYLHSAILHARKSDYPVSISGCEGNDEYTYLRMPAHSFGWDIMPRFPSAGLWRSVYIESRSAARLTQTYFAVKSASSKFAMVLHKFRFVSEDSDLDGYIVRLSLDGNTVYEKSVHFTSAEYTFTLQNPRLWWPLGYGEAETYTAKTELLKNGTVLDQITETVGIRTAEVVHKMLEGDSGEFLIKINGVPVLAKGANWVPMDAFHSRDKARYANAIELYKECGCNILRLWGGNVYEDKELFELCDKNGILVWHDFSMACAVYPQYDEFKKTIYEEAVSVIRKHRNHPCILLWAGDNEVDETYIGRGYSPDTNRYNSLTREVLPRAVRENDPFRIFIPSSPYIPEGFRRYAVPEQHCWGPRAYYKDDFYRLTSAHFISECGYHGCPSPESLMRFIPKAELEAGEGEALTAHSCEYRPYMKRGYDRNKLMKDQVELLFGATSTDLETFAFQSQFTQAEAKKFFIEQTRIKKWRRTGIIWWNMIDGWPQISDSVVDWYYVKKRAFDTIRRVQTPICVILDEPSGWSQDIILANDSRRSAGVHVRLADAGTGEVLFEGDEFSQANENAVIGSLRVIASKQRLIIIEWFIDGRKYKNHYLCGFPPFDTARALKWAKIIDEE